MELSWPSTAGQVLLSVLILIAPPLLAALYDSIRSFWWTPQRIRRVFEAQGIPCLPNQSIIFGNASDFAHMAKQATSEPMAEISHNIAPRIMPYYYEWSKKYGKKFVYWLGPTARYHLTDPEDAKTILATKFGHYRKNTLRHPLRDIVGNGLTGLEGEKWAQHRRIMNPAFYPEKLKAMSPVMAECIARMFEKWDAPMEEKQEIDVHKEFKDLTADIIAHTAFGSSFNGGKQIFELQQEQQLITMKILYSVYIPGSRFLPTATNRYRWQLKRKVDQILRKMIKNRLHVMKNSDSDSYGRDLLGLMMSANMGLLKGSQRKLNMGIDDIIAECKIFFFAGHETTATLLTWTCLLLATNMEWQERAREEILAKFGKADVSAESINNLKIVGMVLNEALRLYPPAVFLGRMSDRDMKLGTLTVPAKTHMVLPILCWHHDPEYWGEDANEFKPERFADGVAKATLAAKGAFLPFSAGPRICIGQAFALQESKLVLCMILQRFRFFLSPSYRHAPTSLLTLQPQYGMPLLFNKL